LWTFGPTNKDENKRLLNAEQSRASFAVEGELVIALARVAESGREFL
jgi:hypothetical protein